MIRIEGIPIVAARLAETAREKSKTRRPRKVRASRAAPEAKEKAARAA
jgi:hypothetical protein